MKETAPKPRRPPAFLAPVLCAIALAQPLPARGNCSIQYIDCVEAAAEQETFWKRSAAGIVCLVTLVDCFIHGYA